MLQRTSRSLSSVSASARRTAGRSVMILASLLLTAAYVSFQAFSYQSGIAGQTERTTQEGCVCHCPAPNPGMVTTTISGVNTVQVNQTYNFKVTVHSGSALLTTGGVDIAVGRGQINPAGADLKIDGAELTHNGPQSLAPDHVFNFVYTAPATFGTDTIYATGLASNDDQSNDNQGCQDAWSHALRLVITVNDPQTQSSITFRPDQVVNFGNVRVNTLAGRQIQYCNDGTDQITISSTTVSDPKLWMAGTPQQDKLQQGACNRDSIFFLPKFPGDVPPGTFTVNNNGSQPATAKLLGRGVQGAISFTPERPTIEFGSHEVGSVTLQTIVYRNSGDDTVFMLPVFAAGNGYQVVTQPTKTALAPNEFDSLTIAFAPTTGGGNYLGSLVMNAMYGLNIRPVPINGSAIGGTAIMIDFGDVVAGQSRDSCISVTNPLPNEVQIKPAVLAAQGFTIISQPPTTIPGGATVEMCIRFSPTEGRNYTGAVNVNSANDLNIVKFILQGRGISGRIFSDDEIVYLGSAKIGKTLTGAFHVRNVGNGTLTTNSMIGLRADGGSNDELSITGSQQLTLPEGSDEATVTVSYKPKNAGCDTFVVQIASSDAITPMFNRVKIIGCGLASSLTSGRTDTISFGTVNITGGAAKQQIQICSDAGEDVAISGSMNASTEFSVTQPQPTFIKPHDCVNFDVQFKPTAVGKLEGHFTVTGDDGTFTRTFVLVGEGINTNLSYDNPVDFGRTLVFSTTTKALVVRNTGSIDVTITGLTTNPDRNFRIAPNQTFPRTLKPGDTTAISVRFVPTTGGPFRGEAVVATNEAASIRINLLGFGISGNLVPSKTLVDFGDVAVGTGKTITDKLNNFGVGPYTLTEVTPGNNGVWTANWPIGDEISSDGFKNSTITFRPDSIGPFMQVYSLFGTGDQSKTITVIGKGVLKLAVRPLELMQNAWNVVAMPNPARQYTTVRVSLDRTAFANVVLVDVTGRVVRSTSNGQLAPGAHDFRFDLQGLPTGSYFARVISNGAVVAQAKIAVNR